jgi:TatD DNase family protein
MHLFDTHCHIHDKQFSFDEKLVFSSAQKANVRQMICVGTSGIDSQNAVDYVMDKPGLWASVGLHPHDAKVGEDNLETIARLAIEPKVVAIGEFGLDYFYDNSPREDQLIALEYQLHLAQSFNKPCIFHVREAFSDFWPVLDNFPGIRGVVHSFTAGSKEVEQAVKRGLYLGLNGIMTFTKDQKQLDAARSIPLQHILLETDSPFLTPTPLRGTINVPANVRLVAACLAEMREESLNQLIEATTENAQMLFSLSKSELINS